MPRSGVTPCTRCGRGLVTSGLRRRVALPELWTPPAHAAPGGCRPGLEESHVRARLIFDCYELPAYKPRNGDWQLSPIEAGQLRQRRRSSFDERP